MSRKPEYEFIPTTTAELEAQMIVDYEALSGETVMPASPERLMISWVASVILGERVKTNYAANQNLPSRADGENLDALAELFYATERPDATPAYCTVRFYISEAQLSAVLIPVGTRVTDGSQTLYWETVEDAWVPIGDTYVDAQVRCQTAGTVGNGYEAGAINTIVDVYDYYSACASTVESDGGADRLSDDEFYEILRMSLDGFSTAGAKGSYIYHAKAVSSEIADVVVNSPTPGEIRLYVLGTDGSKAGDTLKALVLAACNSDDVRPLTDHVLMGDPEEVSYDITFTYYVSDQSETSAELETDVQLAVDSFVQWQQGKLGRDINPSKLISLLMGTGIKRVDLTAPAYVHLRDGNLSLYNEGDTPDLEDTIPQIGKVGTIRFVNGGVEDD